MDNALRRRLLIWPMDTRIKKIDLKLQDTLKSPEHLGGIVKWLMEGMGKLGRLDGQPLPIPASVQAATEQYFSEADNVGQWSKARTTDGGETLSSVLYASFFEWCETKKRKPLAERSFSLWLGRHYTKKRSRDGSLSPLTVS